MSRRVYVCPIVGDGTENNGYRPLIADLLTSGSWSAAIGSQLTGPDRGNPRHDWCLVTVETDDWTVIEGNSQCRLVLEPESLADFDASAPNNRKNTIAQVVDPREVADAVRSANSYRQLIQVLHRSQYPNQDNEERYVVAASGQGRIAGGQSMVAFVEDTFTDSANTTLQNHTPDTGGAWADMGFRDPDGLTSQLHDARISSGNQLESPHTSFQSRVYRNAAEPPGAEYTIRADVRTGTASNLNERSTLQARMTHTGTLRNEVDRYVSGFGYADHAEGALIQKSISGSVTLLATTNPVTAGAQTATVYEMTFAVTDALKTLTVATLLSIDTSDNDIIQTGRVGVSVGRRNGDTSIDNFVAEAEEPSPVEFPVSIVASEDDGHVRESDETIAATVTSIEMGRDDSEVERNAWLRFSSLPIEPGSFIHSAAITFESFAAHSAAVELLIRAQAADNASAPTTHTQYHSPSRTTASVTWTPGAWTTGSTETTVDISNVVKEVIDRPGWVDGNAIVFYVEWVSGGRRRARSFDHETGPAPSLMVEYSDTEPIEAGIDHGIILGHAAAAEQSITAEADHGIVLGHAGTVTVEEPAGPQTFTLPWDSATQPDGPATITADALDAENNVIGTTDRSFTLENVAAVEATIQHGIILGHELAAELGIDVAASHGIVLGHSAEASLTITADAEHGIILGHSGTANVGSDITAAISHGLILGHAAEAESSIEASAEHGIVLGHAGTVNVGSDLSANISHGIVLGHSAEAELGVEASAEHGIVLGHAGSVSVGSDITASISHGIILGHDATVELSAEAAISHGIVLGHNATIDVEIPAGLRTFTLAWDSETVDDGPVTITVDALDDQDMVIGSATRSFTVQNVEAQPVEATISHGIVLGHSAEVNIEAPAVPVEAEISHGIVLGHSGTVVLRVPVDAAISHGIVLGHSMTVDVEIIIVPPPKPLTARRGPGSLVLAGRGAASVAQAQHGPRGIVTVRRGPKSTIGG